jgi:hypothetical protein
VAAPAFCNAGIEKLQGCSSVHHWLRVTGTHCETLGVLAYRLDYQRTRAGGSSAN